MILNVLLIMVIVRVSNLLRSLEGVVIARHVGHDRPLIRLRSVDQIYRRRDRTRVQPRVCQIADNRRVSVQRVHPSQVQWVLSSGESQ